MSSVSSTQSGSLAKLLFTKFKSSPWEKEYPMSSKTETDKRKSSIHKVMGLSQQM